MYANTEHVHPLNPDEVLEGQQLEPEELIRSDDVYPDKRGKWMFCSSFPDFRAKDLAVLGPVIRLTIPALNQDSQGKSCA